MAPLSCASVTDLYGTNFGLSAEQLAQKMLKNNEECAEKNSNYQNHLKENEIAGRANFKKVDNGQLIPPSTINNSQFARRVAFSNKNNDWPTNQEFSMFNRFQNPFVMREDFTPNINLTDSQCLQYLVSITKEVLFVLKIIMIVLILLVFIKILEKKN